ncbi:MAG TPA: helix-turn-helix domain-containing protein [Planctomycetota bacterium]|jgi:predicted DNA-binding transcriptional regulator AlpA|nr:helix-turn-helix domain-containing protein [Planctomycetota bacterium]
MIPRTSALDTPRCGRGYVASAPSRDPEYLSLRDAAAFLSVSPRQVRHWRSLGSGPPAIRLGRHLRFSVSDLRAFAESRREPEGRGR